MAAPLRVLVVDDTAVYRATLRGLLAAMPDVEVVGTAPNGCIALARVDQLRPDLVTLDVTMPVMDGIAALQRLQAQAPEVAVVMVSALTHRDAQTTIAALDAGAFDFIGKPSAEAGRAANRRLLARQLRRVLTAFTAHRVRVAVGPGPQPRSDLAPASSVPATAPAAGIDLAAVGVSTGGPRALARVIPALRADLSVPVAVVQHMPPTFTAALAESLDRRSQVRVVEAVDGAVLEPATVYLAPGGHHLCVVRRAGRPVAVISDAPPRHFCRPSVDTLFESVAHTCGGRALGVVMTGMGADGAAGAVRLRAAGARIVVQDEATSVVHGMPMEAIRRGVVEAVLPLDRIALEIERSALAGRGGGGEP